MPVFSSDLTVLQGFPRFPDQPIQSLQSPEPWALIATWGSEPFMEPAQKNRACFDIRTVPGSSRLPQHIITRRHPAQGIEEEGPRSGGRSETLDLETSIPKVARLPWAWRGRHQPRYGDVAVVLFAAAPLACSIPARRASRIAPAKTGGARLALPLTRDYWCCSRSPYERNHCRSGHPHQCRDAAKR
jgi:hypothetical protein